MLDIKITKTTNPAPKPEKGTQLGFGKIFNYLFVKWLLKVSNFKGYTELFTDCGSISYAFTVIVFIFVKATVYRCDAAGLIFKQKGRHGTVYTATHSKHNFFAHNKTKKE